jgi:hypothetical protein
VRTCVLNDRPAHDAIKMSVLLELNCLVPLMHMALRVVCGAQEMLASLREHMWVRNAVTMSQRLCGSRFHMLTLVPASRLAAQASRMSHLLLISSDAASTTG